MSFIGDFASKTDQELVALSLSNQDNFLLLMRRYEDRLKHYIVRLSGFSFEDAQDVLQDVFIKVYYNLNDFDSSLKFSSWIYRITHNETVSKIRAKHSRPAIHLEEEDWGKLASEFDISKQLHDNFARAEIFKILDKMDEKYRDIIILRFFEEKDYEEISDVLRQPINTIGTWLNRAKKIFKKEYEKKYGQFSR